MPAGKKEPKEIKVVEEVTEEIVEEDEISVKVNRSFLQYGEDHMPAKVDWNDLRISSYEDMKLKGFWNADMRRNKDDLAILFISELIEGFSELRKGRKIDYIYAIENGAVVDWEEGKKPEGPAVDIADFILRVADYCGAFNIENDPLKNSFLFRLPQATDAYEAYKYVTFENFKGIIGWKEGKINTSGLIVSVTRLLVLCEVFGIDIWKIVYGKKEYNKSRPNKHGSIC